MKVLITYSKTILAALLIGASGGCATPTSEDDFGNSVRRMFEAQKYVPADQKESKLPSLDGQKAEASVNQYRTDAGNPARIEQGMGSSPAPASK